MKTIFSCLLITLELHAAFEISNSQAFLSGMSNSVVATKQFHSAFQINPAVSSVTKKMNISLSYYKPFNLTELNFASIITNFKYKGFGVGFTFSCFGNSIYEENHFTINLSHSVISNKLDFGANLNWYSLKVKNYGSIHAVGLDVGVQYTIHSNLLAAFSIQNVNQPVLQSKSNEIPVVTNWGLELNIDDQFSTNIAVVKESWFPVSFHFGLLYKASSFIAFNSGFNTNPAVPSLGLRFTPNWISINYAIQYHFELGPTHFWGLSFTKY